MQPERRFERSPSNTSIDPKTVRCEGTRLSRRHFLRSGAAAAGIAALAGVEQLRPRLVQAQTTQPAPRASEVILLSSSSTRLDGEEFCNAQALLGRHSYRFDYVFGKGNVPQVPANLVTTFRDRLCDIGTELERVVQPAPFKSLDAVPRDFPPRPQRQGFGRRVLVYQLIEQINDESLRVYEWNSFYCANENVINVRVERPHNVIQYDVIEDPDGPPIPVDVVDDGPRVDSFELLRPTSPFSSVGPVFFAARNEEDQENAWARWQRTLPLRNVQDLRVIVHVPGTAQPEERTKQAQFQVMHADGIAIVPVDQQKSRSEWVTLGVYPFRPGNVTVMLTDRTGEPAGEKIVVADAIRWING